MMSETVRPITAHDAIPVLRATESVDIALSYIACAWDRAHGTIEIAEDQILCGYPERRGETWAVTTGQFRDHNAMIDAMRGNETLWHSTWISSDRYGRHVFFVPREGR
jgi:hypothetical protein